MNKRRGNLNEAREITIYLEKTDEGCELREIGEKWGRRQCSSECKLVYLVMGKERVEKCVHSMTDATFLPFSVRMFFLRET